MQSEARNAGEHTRAAAADRARAPQRPQRSAPRIFRATVVATRWLTPHLKRITVRAPELGSYEPFGPDEYIGLLLPRPGVPLVLPVPERPAAIRAAVAELPEETRPDLRWYTVSGHCAHLSEVDIDMVVHGDTGPGSRFAGAATVGDVIGLRECSALYDPPRACRSQLLVGDETSLPAIARVLAEQPYGIATTAVIEVPHPDERLELARPVTWVIREGDPGVELERAVRGLAGLERIDYAWVCAEREGVQRIRRFLVNERGISKERITFSGYWRLGEARG